MMFYILIISWLLAYEHQTFAYRTIRKNKTLGEDSSDIKKTTNLPSFNSREVDGERSLSDDIIELNVGGEKMTTLRSTLTAVPKSKLSLMFSKHNSKKMLPVDIQGAVFFDYNPVYFSYLLDQLRAIKRIPKQSGYQVQFSPPFLNSQVNFTHMLVDLGLTPEYFLSPMEGTHINLNVSSLAGWTECYRSSYDVPFDLSILTKACNRTRLLVACRPVSNRKMFTVAAIGHREDILHPCLPKQCKVSSISKRTNKKLMCSSRYQCITQAKRGVGWYHVNNETWGFVRGSLSFVVNPCDASNLDSDYRLCWTTQRDIKRGSSGDRCGSTKNLQNSNKWERLIYYIN